MGVLGRVPGKTMEESQEESQEDIPRGPGRAPKPIFLMFYKFLFLDSYCFSTHNVLLLQWP
jgi:hypothetical protein